MSDLCLWSENEDGRYETECEHQFEFFEDDPTANHFAFCPYCGKRLEWVAFGGDELEADDA